MNSEITEFVRSSFRSVWSLELMLLLQREPTRCWQPDELVSELRGSRTLVDQSVLALLAAAFIFTDGEGRICYRPATPEIDRLARATADAYRRKPDAVRRVILTGSGHKLHMLADAFRLKGD
jgi:hypothetical protein